MSVPGLRLPLIVAALFLTLVLASLVLLPPLLEPVPAIPAEIVLQDSEPLPPGEPEGQSAESRIEPAPTETSLPCGWRTEGDQEYYLLPDGTNAVGLHRIDGRLYYFDQFGVKARSLGVDVSYYDNSIDWELVKSQGIDFAIIRVGGRGWTSGVIYDDCRTQEYLRRARAAGVRIGVYFYSTAIDPAEAVEEAKMTLSALDGIPLELPIFIDMEFSGQYPRGRADRLSPSERAEIALAFCETVRAGGYEAGVYASQNYLKASIDYSVISRYTIWLASYTAHNRLPNFSKRFDLWQFTDRGRIPGIPGDADVNVIF